MPLTEAGAPGIFRVRNDPDRMMIRTPTAPLWVGLVMLGTMVVAGCGSSSPGVRNARTDLESNDYASALESVEAALEADSLDTEAYLLKARILRAKADTSLPPDEYIDLHRRARDAEEEGLAVDADLRETVETRWMQVYEREWDRGTLAYNEATKNDREALYRRAVASYGAAGIAQADSARPLLNEAFARLRLGEQEAAIPVLETYVDRADPPRKKGYKLLGRLYLEDQSEKATRLLDQAVRHYPDDQELQSLRLNAYNRAGNVDRALDAYRKQVGKNPQNATYRYNYGALLLEAERYADAIAQLDSAVTLRPSHVGSQYNLGAAYVNAALARDDSIATLEAKGSAAAADTANLDRRIDTLAQRRQAFFEKAIPPLERARKMEKGDSPLRRDACRALMVAYVQTGRPNQAAQVEACTGFAGADPE